MNIHSYIDQPSSQKQQTVYLRTSERNIPSQPLQPYLDARPVLTKYSILPIVDPRTPAHVPMKVEATYNSKYTFNPGNTMSPWSGYASNVNTESVLRNQIYALQKCSQAVYVPSSNSDLYKFGFKSSGQGQQQPFPELFTREKFNQFNPNPENLGNDRFYNCTRQQVKNLTDTQFSGC